MLDVSIDIEIKNKYVEINATRDLIVHNNGIVNEFYIRKSGDRARAQPGDRINVDFEYFDESISCIKDLVISIHKQLETKFK